MPPSEIAGIVVAAALGTLAWLYERASMPSSPWRAASCCASRASSRATRASRRGTGEPALRPRVLGWIFLALIAAAAVSAVPLMIATHMGEG